MEGVCHHTPCETSLHCVFVPTQTENKSRFASFSEEPSGKFSFGFFFFSCSFVSQKHWGPGKGMAQPEKVLALYTCQPECGLWKPLWKENQVSKLSLILAPGLHIAYVCLYSHEHAHACTRTHTRRLTFKATPSQVMSGRRTWATKQVLGQPKWHSKTAKTSTPSKKRGKTKHKPSGVWFSGWAHM